MRGKGGYPVREKEGYPVVGRRIYPPWYTPPCTLPGTLPYYTVSPAGVHVRAGRVRKPR